MSKKIQKILWNDDDEIPLLIIIHVLHVRVSINDMSTRYYVNKRLEKSPRIMIPQRVSKGKGTTFKHKLTRVGTSNNFVVLVRRNQFSFFSIRKLSPEIFLIDTSSVRVRKILAESFW